MSLCGPLWTSMFPCGPLCPPIAPLYASFDPFDPQGYTMAPKADMQKHPRTLAELVENFRKIAMVPFGPLTAPFVPLWPTVFPISYI